MDLSGHKAGVVVRNVGSVLWDVTAYPRDGYTLVTEGQDLVLVVPEPEPEPVVQNDDTMTVVMVCIVVLVLFVAAG